MQKRQSHTSEVTLRIAERANRLSLQRPMPPGGELALWLEAEAEVKREEAHRERILQ